MRLLHMLPLISLSLACRTGDKAEDDYASSLDTGGLSSIDADGDGSPASEDCNDNDASVHAGATEICDGVDNDCDGEVDEGVTGTWYTDDDGDGYGDPNAPVEDCNAPSGVVDDDTDCDDTDDGVHPDARELCDSIDNDCNGVVDDGSVYEWFADTDGDGHGDPADMVEDCAEPLGYVATGEDCDDTEFAVNPDADEVCNDIDDNCDGDIDEPTAIDAATWYRDRDSDGYGDDDTAQTACDQPSGSVDVGGDCDDTEFDVNPDAAEICDAIDNDCDGLIDDDDSDVDTSRGGTFYADDDGDGYGDSDVSVVTCAQPVGFVTDDTDCNDTDATINPSGAEVCDGSDNDCNGDIDDDDAGLDTSTASSWYSDEDGDGYPGDTTVLACIRPTGGGLFTTDCDDDDSAVNPGASEICNSIDDDCNGFTDDDDSGVDTSTGSTFYTDRDSDGYGGATTVEACSQPAGTTLTSTDCDDATAAVNPGASEICNNIDDDCDGLTDDDDSSVDLSSGATFYTDRDSDGYGGTSTVQACVQPTGTTATSTDCNDNASAINPGASEICNSIDDDCDGLTDDDDSSLDASTGSTYYTDRDSDGYGGTSTVQACVQPTGTTATSTDCNDNASAINPGASEICNSIDDDCDGLTDDDDSSLDASTGSTYYTDRDSDGYGGTFTVQACVQPTGTTATSTDCDDSAAAINPGASEICNSIDDDCDGLTDDDDSSLDASTGTVFYRDNDNDSYGDSGSTRRTCTVPSGYAANSTDCNDSDSDINPGEDEICNSIDDDCDGLIDDDDADLDLSTADIWWADTDMDGYGDASVSTTACDEPSGYTDDDSDCDDLDVDVNPGASEDCNGYDDDCDGTADSTAVCPCDVEYRNGDTEDPYMFCGTQLNWANASTACQSYGYELITINNSSEDSWANSTADSYSTQKWWIGLNDRATEGTFVWASGQTATYRNWHAGEPNDSSRREDCAQLNRFSDTSWNDEPCGYQFRYVCEAN